MKCRLTIIVEVESESSDLAEHIVDEVIEGGAFQDAVAEYESDDGSAEVTNIAIKSVEEL